MSRILLAFSAAMIISAAGPAAAFNTVVGFPTLTYPPVATPDVTQGCTDLNVATPTCAPTNG